MNRIKHLFENKKRDILNIYFTAGFPKLNDTGTIIKTLAEAGADIIEVGMPYSDPLADGPTIQQSGTVALQNGMKLDLLFEQIKEVRQHTNIPLIMMGYFNQMMQYGETKFIERCSEVGVDGLILPDMPLYVYEEQFKALFEKHNICMSFLITPNTPEERIRKIDSLTRGFIYMVSSASITGAKTGISEEQLNYFNRINSMSLKNPRLIGFGISSYETFNTACRYAQGAIIGSAFIRMLEKADGNIESEIHHFVESIRGVNLLA